MATIAVERLLAGLLDKVGGKALEVLLDRLSNWPNNPKEAQNYYDSVRQATKEEISNAESVIKQNLKLLMERKRMKEYKALNDAHNLVRSLRQDIEKTVVTNFTTQTQEYETIRSLSAIYLTLQYEVYIIKHLVNRMTRDIYNDESIMDSIIDLIDQAKHLQTTISLRNQANADPTMAKMIYKNLKDHTKMWSKLLEESANISKNSMSEMLAGAILSKPKLFNKKDYIEKLSEYTWQYSNRNNIDKIGVPELMNNMRERMPNVEFNDEDMEKAIQLLIEKNKAYSLNIENNIKVVEFKRTEKSLVCGNCGKHGGMYEEFRTCENKEKYVCADCITFFGKCKLCGESIKTKHPLVR